VSPAGTKSWIFRYTLDGKSREMGLGALHTVSLAEARGKAADCRKQLDADIDPLEARDAKKVAIALEAAKSITFAKCAESYIRTHKADWKNAKHADQWTNTIETYCGPIIGSLPVQAIDTGLVMKILEPMWSEKPETATRLRGRIERVLDWAKVSKYRSGENPARWRGHLDKLLPALKKSKRVKHYAALPFNAIGEFIESLRAQEGVAGRALEFVILTAARTGEAISAKWEEIDLVAALWTIPGARMKAGREHRVPLSPAAVKLLQGLEAKRHEGFVFRGPNADAPLSNMAMLELLKRMKRTDLTVHGFRSTFRDWASELTNYPTEMCEMALAHAVGDKVEAAYRRGDLFDKRRRLMADWARFCEQPKRSAGAAVVQIGRQGTK
jgi:integrase